jgi:hypothetical protein
MTLFMLTLNLEDAPEPPKKRGRQAKAAVEEPVAAEKPKTTRGRAKKVETGNCHDLRRCERI